MDEKKVFFKNYFLESTCRIKSQILNSRIDEIVHCAQLWKAYFFVIKLKIRRLNPSHQKKCWGHFSRDLFLSKYLNKKREKDSVCERKALRKVDFKP